MTIGVSSYVKTKDEKALKRRMTDRSIDDWDEYFLSISQTVGRKSKDPKSRVGAIITSPDSLVLSTGFNGLARGVYDDVSLLSDGEEKLLWICHAEFNAIVNASRMGVALKGASIYVTKFPCLACCNAIIQSGIERIYTHANKFWGNDQADLDHTIKKSLIKQSGILVDAPYHPDFMPKTPIT